MRIAYVGLSSPLAYFYDHGQTFTARQEWHWNPILESPVGLSTLFDEIWFLHRALCPLTMRNCGFVRFLDSDSDMVKRIEPYVKVLHDRDSLEFATTMKKIQNVVKEHIAMFSDILFSTAGMSPSRGTPIDNHSHGFDFGNSNISGNSWSPQHLAFDLLVADRLSQTTSARIELVTNTFTDRCLPGCPVTRPAIGSIHEIIVRRIPVLQVPIGPILDGIQTVRENKYLDAFRRKLVAKSSELSWEEMEMIVDQIETEYERYKLEVLLEHQADAGILTSLARNAISIAVPLISETADMVNALETREMNWTAFLASLERNGLNSYESER